MLGVPIFVTPSWLLIAAFITISYADFLHTQVRGLSDVGSYALALVFAVALAASVLAHELGHTVVSRAFGLTVRRIVVFLLGGVSEIEGEPARPRDEFAIAAAGPAVSFVLAGLCWAASLPVAASGSLGVMLSLLAWSNLVIAIFNVLPGLPLDGGRLVQALVWMLGHDRDRAAVVAAWSGRVMAVVLAALVVLGNALLSQNRSLSFTDLGAAAMGFAIAAFLWLGASQTLRAAGVSAKARALHTWRLVRPAVYLPGTTPVSEAVRQLTLAGAGGIVVVDAAGRSRAVVQESQVRRLDPAQQPWLTVADVARPLESGLILDDTLTGDALLEAVRNHPASEYLVVGADGTTRGLLATTDLARALGLPLGGP